jgi:site-specific DNA-methyltransferase (cytosine-N4-specific)
MRTWIDRCHFGDCRDTMRAMAADGVKAQCIMTSPPYWGLRDYGHPGQLGLEPTIGEYVANMVEVFRLARDVLSDDGVLWLNLGDCYATGAGMPQDGLKPKDLVGMPWRVAFALQADGWWLRQDIIWSKPSPMPESIRDRCTKAHEYLFLLAKSERYYFDADAIATDGKLLRSGSTQHKYVNGDEKNRSKTGFVKMSGKVYEKVNRRSVWTIPSVPYAEAHFAAFPPALVEPCILAGSRPGDTILDPFFGSGTVGQVAQHLGRCWIGCEIQDQYASLQEDRTRQLGLVLCAP